MIEKISACKKVDLHRRVTTLKLFYKDRENATTQRNLLIPRWLGHPRVGELLFRPPCTNYLYSTRPHGLVQAIFWHTCPDLNLGPWYCLTHSTHIALSGSMTSRVRVSARSRPFSPPPFIPTLIGLRAFDLVSSPVWWEAATNTYLFRGEVPVPVLALRTIWSHLLIDITQRSTQTRSRSTCISSVGEIYHQENWIRNT